MSNFDDYCLPSQKSETHSQNPFAIDEKLYQNIVSPKNSTHQESVNSPFLSNMNWEMNSNSDPPQLNLEGPYDSLNLDPFNKNLSKQ